MQSIFADMRAAVRNLTDDGPSMVVLLVVGYVIAYIVQFVASIAFFMLFVGSGGSLPLTLAYVPMLLGGAFMVVTIASVARAFVSMDNGDDARARGWGAVPMVALMCGIVVVAATVVPIAAVPIVVIVGWCTMLAMLDIMSTDSPLGLGAAWEVLRSEPVRCAGAVVITAVIAVATSFVPAPTILLSPLLLIFQMSWGYEIYRSVMPDPADAMRQQEVASAEQRRDERRPPFLASADEQPAVDATVLPIASAAASSPAPAWMGVTLSTEYGSSAGGWLELPDGCALLEVSTAPLPATRVLLVSSGGDRFDLPRTTAGSWCALLPHAGSWFVAIDGAGTGCTVQWRASTGGAAAREAAA